MSWPTAYLGDLCQINIGRTPSRSVSAYWEEGSNPWLSISDMGRAKEIRKTREGITDVAVNDCNMRPVKPGTVLFSFKLTIGKLGIAAEPLFTNEAIASLPIIDRHVLCEDYLFHALQEVSSRLVGDRAAMGTTLNKASLAQIEIPLPPLEEQRRIAAILDKASSLIASEQKRIKVLLQIEASLFLEMAATASCAFQVCALKDLTADGDKINYGVIQPGDQCDEGVPLIRVGDLTNGHVDRSSIKYIDPEVESAYSRSRIRGNEILVSCVGSIGVIAEVGPDDIGSNIARAVARVPVSESVNRKWLAAYLRSDNAQRYFINELRTVSQPTLNIKQIEETAVPLPPVELQEAFATKLDSVLQIFQRSTFSTKRSKVLIATLQSKAFTGAL